MSNRETLMKKFARDMLFFGKTIRPKIFEIPSPEFHRKLSAYLRRSFEFPRLNIIAPRGFAKTTVVAFIYVMWHVFIEDYANGRKRTPKFVVLVSKSRPHAINLLDTIKNCLEHSHNFKRIFGYWGEHSARQWRSGFIKLKDGTIIDCRGMGQQIRGMNIDSMRPTLVVLDDAEDEENTKTDNAIAYNQKWFLQALSPMVKRTEPKGRIVNIGTPQHESCLVFFLRKMKKQWKTLHFSAIIEHPNGQKESLWPEMMSLKELDTLRDELEEAGRVSSFYREYMCQVVGDSDSLVTSKDLKYWDGRLRTDKTGRQILEITERGAFPGLVLQEPEHIPVYLFQGVDPASTISSRADYSVIMVLAVDKYRNIYVVDYYRKRVKPMDLAKAIIQYYEMYMPERTRIESTGYQEMLRDYLRNEYEQYIPGIEIKHAPRNSKSHRLESLQPLFGAGKVFVKEEHKELIDELLMYPRATHDDTLDGFYYAQLNAYGPVEGRSAVEQMRVDNEVKYFLRRSDDDIEEYNPSSDWLLA